MRKVLEHWFIENSPISKVGFLTQFWIVKNMETGEFIIMVEINHFGKENIITSYTIQQFQTDWKEVDLSKTILGGY